MKNKSWIQSIVLACLIVIVFAGCHEEPLRAGGGADCGGCEDIPPGGGTVTTKCGDLIITNVSVLSSKGNVLRYTVFIQNVGTRSVDVSGYNVTCQGYLSVNGTSHTRPACGTITGPYILAPGAVAQQNIECNFSLDVNLSEYPYLIVELLVQNIAECRSDNNTFVRSVNL